MGMSDIRMVHNSELLRYELFAGTELVSIAEYSPAGEALVFDHTETRTDFRGRGLAARLVAYALDDVRKQGKSIVPACSFVSKFVAETPVYQDLLTSRVA